MPTIAETNGAGPFVELANRSNRGLSSSHFDRLEFLPQLRGRRQAEVYREMADNDSLIGAILFAIEMVLRRVDWEVEPGGEQTPEDLERADFLSSCMSDMSMTWEELIADALTMLPFGFAYLETVYKRREDTSIEADAERRTKHPDGRIGWRKFTLVPHETIGDWEVDEHGGVRAAVQGSPYGESRVRIPIEKALLFRTARNSPRGKSVLRRVVESWYYRKRMREIEGIGVERDLAGLPVFYLDEKIMADATRRAEYEAIVRNLRRDEQEGVLLPAIYDEERGELKELAKLELLSTGGSRQFDTNAIINRYAREIAVALLQDVVLLGHEKVGTQALASEKRDLSDTALQAWLNDIAAILNTHAVPRLFALNGAPLSDLPQLKPHELRPTDLEEFMEALKNAGSAGFLFDDEDAEQEVRHRLGLPPRSDEHAEQAPPPESEGPDDLSAVPPPNAEERVA